MENNTPAKFKVALLAASPDFPFVTKVAAALAEHGFDVILLPTEEKVDAVIIILSRWLVLDKELLVTYQETYGTDIVIPIQVGVIQSFNNFPEIQAIDCRTDQESCLKLLINTLQNHERNQPDNNMLLQLLLNSPCF